MKTLPTQERLKELFTYNNDGSLNWKIKPCRRMVSKEQAGHKNQRGYLQIKIDYVQYQQHRVIWKLHYGTEPALIDHINGNKADNRIENLRSVTDKQNQQNKRCKGYVDKSSEGRKKPYAAQIKVDGKQITLGHFACPLMAHLEYQKAHVKYFKEYSPYYASKKQ